MLTENGNNGNNNNEGKEEEKSVNSISSSSGEWSIVAEEEKTQKEENDNIKDDDDDVDIANKKDADANGNNEDNVARVITQTLSACASAIDSLVEEMKKDDDDDGSGADVIAEDTIEKDALQPPVSGAVIPKAARTISADGNFADDREEEANPMEASALTVPSIPTEIGSLMGMSTEVDDVIAPHEATTTNEEAHAENENISSIRSNNIYTPKINNDSPSPPTNANITSAESKRHSYNKPVMILLIISSIISVSSITAVIYLARERSAWKDTALELQNELDDFKAKVEKEEAERVRMETILALTDKTNAAGITDHSENDTLETNEAPKKESIQYPENIFFDTLSDKCGTANDQDSSSSSFVVDNCWLKAKISISSGLCMENFKQRSKTTQKDFVSLLRRVHEAAHESFWSDYYDGSGHGTSEGYSAASAMVRSSVKGFSESVRRMVVGHDDSESGDASRGDVSDLENDTMHAETNASSSPRHNSDETAAFANEVSKFLRSVGEGYFFFMDEEGDANDNNVHSDKQTPKQNTDISETITTIESVLEDKMEQVADSIKQGVSSIFDLIGDVTRDSIEALHATK